MSEKGRTEEERAHSCMKLGRACFSNSLSGEAPSNDWLHPGLWGDLVTSLSSQLSQFAPRRHVVVSPLR